MQHAMAAQCTTYSQDRTYFQDFVASTVRHAIAYAVHTKNRVQVSPHLVKAGKFLKQNDGGQNWGMRLVIECNLQLQKVKSGVILLAAPSISGCDVTKIFSQFGMHIQLLKSQRRRGL